MRKFLFILVAFALFSNGAIAEKFTVTYNFEMPDIIKKGDYRSIAYPNCHNFGAEGTPSIPYYAVDLLLKQGHEIASIKVLNAEYFSDKKFFRIEPAQKQFPLSHNPETPYIVKENAEVYSSSEAYPSEITSNSKTQFLAGHSIGAFTICPVQYVPANEEVSFLKRITIEIETSQTAKALSSLSFAKNNNAIAQRIENIVDNPELLKSYEYSNKLTTDEVDLLLISTNALLPAFQEFVDFKTSTGFIVETIATDDIYNSYTGQDEAEKIRNCIIDYYQNKNLQYVVFGGDADGASTSGHLVPCRGLNSTAYGTPDDNIPGDIYYSGLDGTWDDNSNGVWGEDGEEDLLAEVFVGRICVDDASEIANFVNKIIKYQNEPVVADIEKALMLGELLWSDPTWGGDYKDEVSDGSSSHGYTTVGISENFNVEKLYEKNGDWSIQDVFDQFSVSGLNLLNHLGHCDVTYCMTMDNPDVTNANFQNDGETRGYVIGYSQGCYCGSFDNRGAYGSFGTEDCFAEAITNLENGMVATIMNSRYGWGQHSSTDGASQYFDRQFFDAIFGENLSIIGMANAKSKEDNIAYINSHEGAIRWCAYQTNLFGDPSMDIWTAQPVAISASYSTGVSIGSSQININTDAPYARIALLQNGELIGRAVANENGSAIVECFEPLSDATPINVVITAHNKEKHEGTIYVFSDVPYVVYHSMTINDPQGNNNNLADYCESLTLSVELKNVGSQPASAVAATISTQDEFVTITDNEETYGAFSSEQTILIENAFAIEIADNVPDKHTAQFEVEATDGDSVWISYFNITINAPVIEIGEMEVLNDDNGNGRLDPGETAELVFYTTNIGHAICNNPEVTLLGNSPYFTIEDNMFDIDPIAVDEEVEVTFNVSAHNICPNGTVVELSYEVTDIESVSEDKTLIIGQPPQITIGSGSEPSSYYPFYTYYENNKSQMLYLGSEFGSGEMLIQEIAYDFAAIGGIPSLTDLKVNFKETDLSTLGNNYEDMSGATTVFENASYTMPAASGWHVFDIQDFNLNAQSNLLIEVVWGDNGAWDDAFNVNCTNSEFTSVVYGYADSETPPAYDGNSSSRPNMMFYFEGDSPADMYTITFNVLDIETNNPIENATVTVGTLTKVTDATGTVAFELYEAEYTYTGDSEIHRPESDLFMADADKTVEIHLLNNEGINDLDDAQISIFPNPSSNKVVIDAPFNVEKLEIITQNGELVKEELGLGSNALIDLSNLASGTYFVKIVNGKNEVVKKLTIINNN